MPDGIGDTPIEETIRRRPPHTLNPDLRRKRLAERQSLRLRSGLTKGGRLGGPISKPLAVPKPGGLGGLVKGGSIAALVAFLLPNILDSMGFFGPETRRLKFDEKALAASQASEAAALRIGQHRELGESRERAATRRGQSADLRAVLQNRVNLAGIQRQQGTEDRTSELMEALTQAGIVGRHNAAAVSLGLL
ncbi:hypothetical protein LCGC14_1813790 [marine sediment metagenome]|uniref:Uncharacterized protein n=1 Tax=marine sediment metagenome TaxID=412755 RepID=A0A0F9GL45_9ZZZZ